jgi:selenocysteine lyase/cysteine desulfurase
MSAPTTSSTVPATAGADPLGPLRAGFRRVPGYLNAATVGLPSLATAQALTATLQAWQAGRMDAADFDTAVTRSRLAFARLVGTDPARVAVGSQASVSVGLVAAALPDGARVVSVHGDFTSVVFPFLVHADRGVQVRQVPLEGLADAVAEGCDLVAFSLVQSADGRVADAGAVRAAAAAVGALTLCDTTQAVGWLPVRADDWDVTVCSAYKWLSCPRGAAFSTTGAHVAARLRPLHAGWYAGESIWESTYGPGMTLAADARRFDVSPAWFAWAGAAPVLELFADADVAAVHRHDVALADGLLARLGLPPRGSAVVALPDPDGRVRAALEAAGCAVAGRAGRVRIAFHVWNDGSDAERAALAVRGVTG